MTLQRATISCCRERGGTINRDDRGPDAAGRIGRRGFARLDGLRVASAIALAAALVPAFAIAASGGSAATVSGSITLDSVGNQIMVHARTTASGEVRGKVILESGSGGVHGQSHQRIQIDVTCLQVTGSVAFVGGTTVRATEGVGTIHPQYGFVLEDRGAGLADKWTVFALFATVPSNPCLDLFGPAVETSLRGNITISG